MVHQAECLAIFFFCIFGVAESQKESLSFKGIINEIRLVKQNLIVAGNGFLTSIATNTFQNKSIAPEDGKNYSLLSPGKGDTFLACFANTSHTLCWRCGSTTPPCTNKRTRPLYIAQSFGFLQVYSSSIREVFITSQATANQTYISVWKPSDAAAKGSLSLKSGWTSNVQAMTIDEENNLCGLAEVVQGEKTKNVMFKFISNFRDEFDYTQNLIDSAELGQTGDFISVSKSLFYFYTTQGRIGKVAWKPPTSFNTDGHEFEAEGEWKWKVNKDSSSPLTVKEVKGVSKELQENETITSGLTATDLFFLTTNQGRLLKFEMEKDDRLILKYKTAISKEPKARVFLRTEKSGYLYGFVRYSSGNSEVFRVELHDCKGHATCSSCRDSAADPYCSWFPLENTCGFEKSPTSGKSVKTCPEIGTVLPSAVSMEKQTRVNVTLARMSLIPLLNEDFLCQWSFPNRFENTTASVQGNSITCSTPATDSSEESRRAFIDVGLRILMNGILLTEKKKNVTFFDCRHFRSCTSCQRPHSLPAANFSCTWNTTKRNCALTQAASVPAKCPWLEDPAKSSELRIPNNMPWNLTLRGSQLFELQNSGFKCYISGKAFDLRVLSDTHASCYSPNGVNFPTSIFKTFSTLKLFSNSTGISVGIDDGRPLNVTIYECSYLSCRLCLLEEQKGDFLCHNTKETKCKTGRRTGSLETPNCKKPPVVEKVLPMNATLKAGTLVSVSGDWLGLNTAQLTEADGVVLAGQKCTNVQVIEPLESFECTTGPSKLEYSGNITIWGHNTGSPFSYMALTAPFDIKPLFCFTDYPGTFNVTIRNFRVGRRRSITVAGVNLTEQMKNYETSDNYRFRCPTGAKTSKGKISVKVDEEEQTSKELFEFLPAPFLKADKPMTLESIRSGGVWLSFPGSNDLCKYLISASMSVKMSSLRGTKQCELYRDLKSETKSEIRCRSPRCQTSSCQSVGFSVDLTLETVPNVNFSRGQNLTIKYFANPEFVDLENTTEVVDNKLALRAAPKSDLLRGAKEIDYKVTLDKKICRIINVSPNFITCDVGSLTEAERKNAVIVTVHIGNSFNRTLGVVKFVKRSDPGYMTETLIIGSFAIVAVGCLLAFFLYRRHRNGLQKKYLEELDKRMEDAHFAAANASRNAFIEMQTAMSDMQLFDTNAELPYRDFEDFVVSVLLPNPAGKAAALAEFEQCSKSDPTALASPDLVLRFNSQLLCEKPFLLTLIRTFDSSTKLADKSLIGAALSVVLVDRMEYYYEVLRELFHHIVKTNVEERKTDSLTLLFRRSESLMEKMFSNWLTICLYSHLRNSDTGKKLYIVFKALSKFLDMGPVDALRCRAKNVLSEDVLLSEEIDFCVITLRGSLKEEEGQLEPVELQVLSCDTIGQVKEKIIEALFPHRPFSMRPAAEDFVLQWQRSTGSDDSNPFFLPIETQLMSGASNKLPVIGDLNAKDALLGAHLVLVRPSQAGNMNVVGSVSSFASEADDSTNLLARDSFGELIHLCEGNTTSNQTGISKDFSLPHLLKTKHVVHTYIEDLFKSIFNIDIMEPPPPYVEHIFGVIDDAINEVPFDREMMSHVWKSNSYILRVWVNLLKNPEFLFDVNKSLVVNANLSVIAQALMDACCYNPKPTARKGLSSTKLVFLRDIEQYRKWVNEFYTKLKTKKTLPSDQDMSMLYNTMQHTCNFNGDLMFRATRFLFMKSRDLKTKILDNIDVTQWLHTQEERQSFKDRVEAILGSTCTDTMV